MKTAKERMENWMSIMGVASFKEAFILADKLYAAAVFCFAESHFECAKSEAEVRLWAKRADFFARKAEEEEGWKQEYNDWWDNLEYVDVSEH